MLTSRRLLFLWVTALAATVGVGCVPKNGGGRGQRARGTEAWSWRMQATEGTWKVDNKPKDRAAWTSEGEWSDEQGEAEDPDIALPEAPAPKAKKVARAKPAAGDEGEMSFAPVVLRKDEPKPKAAPPPPKVVAKKVAPAPAPAPRVVAAARDNFEEDKYLDELLGETGGPKKKRAVEPARTAEITMDVEELGDPDARERERDMARAKAAGEAAVARMKAKLAKQGMKTYDQGPVPDPVAKPKKKVVVARAEEPEDEVKGEDDAEEETDTDAELDSLGDVEERPAKKVAKRAAPKPEPEPEAEPEPAPAPKKAKKKSKGEFYASGEGFLAEDEADLDESAPEVVGDESDSDDSADDDEAPAPKKKAKKASKKKKKKKSSRAARSSKSGKSRAASKGDRRKKRDSGDDA
jgi:hypothetical protein